MHVPTYTEQISFITKNSSCIHGYDNNNCMLICVKTDLRERQTENDYQMINEMRRQNSGEENDYHVLEGVVGGRHDVWPNRELELRQMTESGEEHDYHILEGPGQVCQGREPAMREMGGATDYEVPMRLKKESSAH